LKFLPVLGYFFHENRRLFEVSTQFFAISFKVTAGYLKFSKWSEPIVVIVIFFMKPGQGWWLFLPVLKY
jgi:hypothetical protein